MIGLNAVENFEEIYEGLWLKEAQRSLHLLQTGLARVNFEHIDIPLLKEVFELTKELSESGENISDPASHIANLKILKEKLTQLASEYDFQDKQFNDFLYHSSRCFERLIGCRYTEKIPYAEAILNPYLEQNDIESGVFVNYLTRISAEKTAENLLSNFSDGVLKIFEMQCASLENIKLTEKPTDVKGTHQEGALRKKLGKHSGILQSSVSVTDTGSAVNYMSDQIYLHAYEFYFNQIITMCEAIEYAEKISKNSAEKNDFLAQHGLLELSTPEAMDYLDNIARVLKFDNAVDLFNQYKKLPVEEALNNLSNKMDFFVKSNKDNNPLSALEKLSSAEYQRLNKRMTDKNFGLTSGAYATQICFAGIDLVDEIKLLMRVKNLLTVMTDDYLNLESIFGNEQERGFWNTVLHYVATSTISTNMVKNRLDDMLFKTIIPKETMLNRYQGRAYEPLQEKWGQYVQDRYAEDNKALIRLVNNVKNGEYSYEKLLDLMTQFQLDEINANHALSTLKEGTDEFFQQTERKEITESILKHDKDIFSLYKVSHRDIHVGEVQYASDIKEMIDLHHKLMSQREIVSTELAESHELLEKDHKLIDLEEAKGNWFARGIRKLFGRKTTEQKEIEQRIHLRATEINMLKRSIKEIEIKQKQISLDIVALEETQFDGKQLNNESISVLMAKFNDQVKNYHHIFNEKKLLSSTSESADKILGNEIRLLDSFNHIEKIAKNLNKKLSNQIDHAEIQLDLSDAMVLLGEIKERSGPFSELKKLESTIELAISHHKKQLQENSVAKLEEIMNQGELNLRSFIEKIVRNDVYQTLDKEYKKELHEMMDKKIAEHIKQHQQTMTLSELREIFIETKSLVLEYESAEGHSYSTTLAVVLDAIDQKYKAIDLLSIEELSQQQSLIQNDLMIGLERFKKSVNEAEYYKNKSELSDFDPRKLVILWQGKDVYKRKKAEAEALQLIYTKELERFVGWVEENKSEMLSLYKEMPIDICKNEINKREIFSQQLSFLQQDKLTKNNLNLDDLVLQNHSIIDSLREIESDHPENHLKTINSEIKMLSQQYDGILKLKETIEVEKKSDSLTFDIENISKMERLLDDSSILNQSLVDTFEKIKKERHNSKSGIGNENNKSDIKGRFFWDESENKLLDLSQKLEFARLEFEQKINPFKIVFQGKSADFDDIPDEALGPLLIFSLKHKNTEAFEEIIKQGHKIDVQSIVQSYLLAATQGDMDKTEKLLSIRDDFVIPAHDLNGALQQAVSENHLDMIYHILLANKLGLDHNADKLIDKMSIQPSNVPKVTKTWTEAILLGEDQRFKDYRACFILAEQLVKKAHSTYESSPKAEQDKVYLHDSLEYILSMNDRLIDSYRIFSRVRDSRDSSYLSSCKEYIQSLVDQTIEKEQILTPASFRDATAQKVEEAGKDLINAINKWDHENVILKLSVLKNLTIENKDRFYKVISKALDESKEEDYLNMLLSAIDEPDKRKDLAGIALLTAIKEGKIERLPTLIHHNGFEGKENDIKELLKNIYDEKIGQRVMELKPAHIQIEKMSKFLLGNVPFEIDPLLLNLIDDTVKELPDTGKYVVEQGWKQRFSDTDKSTLDKLKKIYILQERQLEMLKDNFDTQLLSFYTNQFQEIDDPRNLDKSVIEKLNHLIRMYEERLEKQFEIMDSTRKQFFNDPSFGVQNQDRKLAHIKQWDAQIENSFNKVKTEIKEDINRIKFDLPSEKSIKRQSTLLFTEREPEKTHNVRSSPVAPTHKIKESEHVKFKKGQ